MPTIYKWLHLGCSHLFRLPNFLGPSLALCLSWSLSHTAIAAEWQLVEFPKYEPTQFNIVDSGEITLVANASSGLLYRALTAEEQQAHKLHWYWRVDKAPPATDISKSGGDDRAVAVSVWFPHTGKKTLLHWLKKRATLAAGLPIYGRVLTYVWGSTEAINTVFRDPYFGKNGALLIQRNQNTPLQQWLSEDINFRDDYQRIFNETAPQPAYIAIAADSDDTASKGLAAIKDIQFLSVTDTQGRQDAQ